MAIKATVEYQFTYGKQLVTRKTSETVFPFHFELDEEVITMVEDYWTRMSEVADYDHDGMQTVIKYALGATVIITYEEV